MKNSGKDVTNQFMKEIRKIHRYDKTGYNKLYEDLKALEKNAKLVRSKKMHDPDIKYLKKTGFWQMRSGDYRVLYDFDQNDNIEYNTVFKKAKNQTPKRKLKTAKKRKK